MKTLCATMLLFTVLLGCAHSPPQPSYAEQIAQIPPPTSEEDRQRKCADLRSEIARQQNIAMMGSAQLQGMYAVILQATARKNIAVLESGASDFGCTAAFGNRPVQSNIENCIAACKANTSRTQEQCFDACNH